MTMTHIGCVQLNSQTNIEKNKHIIAEAVADAASCDVNLLVLPENACGMGNQRQISEQFDALTTWYADLAAKHNLFLLAGTLPCPYRPDGTIVPNNRVRQTSQLFAPDGSRLARYDKIHLFRAQVSDSHGSYDESQTFEPGDTTVVAQCDMHNLIASKRNMADEADFNDSTWLQHINKEPMGIGMMVCFDLRFPALAQRLRQSGADILTAPSAFTYKTGEAHWSLLLRARALDAQCLTVGAAQGGKHYYAEGSTRETWGHSTITDANGEVIVSTHTSDLEKVNTDEVSSNKKSQHNYSYYQLITSKFDRQAQISWRTNMPIHHCHRLVG